jgi:hypothetical protein
MYWAVVGFMAMLVLGMLGLGGLCLARELRRYRSVGEMMRGVLAEGER